MRLCRCLLVIAALTVLCMARVNTVEAQNSVSLPSGLVTLGGPLNADQAGTVTQFLHDRIGQLTSGDAVARETAQRDLADQVTRLDASDNFKKLYSPMLSAALVPLMGNSDPEVRLSAMIVASSLIDPGVVQLIITGLKDTSPAVRYWAAKTAGSTGAVLPKPEQLKVLAALGAAWPLELSSPVLGQTLQAMNLMPIPAAQTQLLKALNERVKVHVEPAPPYRADFTGLQGVCVKMVTASPAPSASDWELLTVGLFRYLDVISQTLDQKQAPEANRGDMFDILLLIGQYLPESAKHWAGSGAATNSTDIKKLVETGDWKSLRLCTEEWRKLLASAPYNVKPEDLQMQQQNPGPATTSPSP